MTVDKSRFAAELELPPEAEEMMAKIAELAGCVGVLAAIETGVAGTFIQLWQLDGPGPAHEPGSEQVNGKVHSWKGISQSEFRKFRPFRQLRPSQMSQLGTFPNISARLPWFEYGSDHSSPAAVGISEGSDRSSAGSA
ncbi:MAG: hypothetical protein OXF50_24540 [Caldilineaceae bacterium]|nr:hypothetical protein [Caldilineaceae bacterium]